MTPVAQVLDTMLRGLFFFAVMYGLWKIGNWAPRWGRRKRQAADSGPEPFMSVTPDLPPEPPRPARRSASKRRFH